jgi:hypothetical protein
MNAHVAFFGAPARMLDATDDYEDASVLIASIEAQLSDPTYADRRAAGQAMIDLSLDAHRDAALAKLGYL